MALNLSSPANFHDCVFGKEIRINEKFTLKIMWFLSVPYEQSYKVRDVEIFERKYFYFQKMALNLVL